MSGKTHTYTCSTTWTGNTGKGTASYKAYSRDHVYSAPGKPDLPGSSDPAFRGDARRYNPEELLVASLSSCHMLFYLSIAARRGFVIDQYRDEAVGQMTKVDGKLAMTVVTLHPDVHYGGDARPTREQEDAMHHEAHDECFIARSVKTDVRCEPVRQ